MQWARQLRSSLKTKQLHRKAKNTSADLPVRLLASARCCPGKVNSSVDQPALCRGSRVRTQRKREVWKSQTTVEDSLDVNRPLSDTWDCGKTVNKLSTVSKVAEGLTDAPFAQVEPLRYHLRLGHADLLNYFYKDKKTNESKDSDVFLCFVVSKAEDLNVQSKL